MDKLPLCLLQYILSFLKKSGDQRRLRLVCKFFSRLKLTSFYVNCNEKLANAIKFAKTIKYVSSFNQSIVISSDILTHLSLYQGRQLEVNCPNLENIKLRYVMGKIPINAPKLKVFKLNNRHMNCPESINDFSKFAHLQVLELSNCDCETLILPPQLEELHMYNVYVEDLVNADVLFNLRALTNIISIDASLFRRISFGKSFKRLKYISHYTKTIPFCKINKDIEVIECRVNMNKISFMQFTNLKSVTLLLILQRVYVNIPTDVKLKVVDFTGEKYYYINREKVNLSFGI